MPSLPPIVTHLRHAGRWSGEVDLWVKDEASCKTGTFKDRLAWAYVEDVQAGRRAAGPNTVLTSITLGNTMRSFAEAIRYLEPAQRPRLCAIVPDDFSDRHIGPGVDGAVCRGRDVIEDLEQSGVACVAYPLSVGRLSDDAVKRLAARGEEALVVDDVTNGIGRPAYRRIVEEALDAMPAPPDHIVLPVGAGVLFKECVDLVRDRGLKCAVMGVAVTKPDSIADKIYGFYSDFYAELQRNGRAVYLGDEKYQVRRVDDAQIMNALRRGLPLGFASAEPSSWASLVPLSEGWIAGGRVLVVNTGCGIIPPRRKVERMVHVLKSVQASKIAEAFYSADPLSGGRKEPLSIAEAIGQFSREYLVAAGRADLINGIRLSRLLLGFASSARKNYDRLSLINGFGDAEEARRALHTILAYVLASEVLAQKESLKEAARLVHSLFTSEEDTVHLYRPTTPVPKKADGIQFHGWEERHARFREPAKILLTQLVDLLGQRSVDFPIGEMTMTDRLLDEEDLHKAAEDIIERWTGQEGVIFAELKDPSVLMLAAMDMLGPNWAFAAVPLPLQLEKSFYTWAGLWAILHIPPEIDLSSPQHHDQLHAFNLIGRALMREVQGYAYRLESWQRGVLAENQDAYEKFAWARLLPAILDKSPDASVQIKLPGNGRKAIDIPQFMPQVPFDLVSADELRLKLSGFVSMHRAGYMNRQKQAIEGILHDLQERRIDQASVSKEVFEQEAEALGQRIRSLGIDSCTFEADDPGTTMARRERLRNVREQLRRLCDAREYIYADLGPRIERRGQRKINKRGLRFIFDYKIERPGLEEQTWAKLGSYVRSLAESSPLPFAMDRLNRAIDALVHNFEKYSKPGECCELRAVDRSSSFELQWSVGGGPICFNDFDDFRNRVVGSREGQGRGIHRGLPLALMFGLESGAEQIGVWIRGLRGPEGWHSIVGEKFGDVPTLVDVSYAIRWSWNIEELRFDE